MKHQGCCSCGKVQIGLLTNPIFTCNCHCSHCRGFASKHSKDGPKEYLPTCAVWKWSLVVRGELEYENTNGAGGIFALQRGRCVHCRDPVCEQGRRGAFTFATVMTNPLPNVESDTNLYYDSGSKNGPNDMKVTIYSDIGSFFYQLWLVLIIGLPSLPMSIYVWMFADKSFSNKKKE